MLKVQKFGGTSVGSVENIVKVANIIRNTNFDHKVVVVVSAMAGATNRLVSLSQEVIEKTFATDSNGISYENEYDTVLSVGETTSSALLAIALNRLGIKAISLQGWQIPIITSPFHNKAMIESIDSEKLQELLQNGFIPIISGFQGVTSDNRITTLGRGGSDITALAIAAAMKVDECDIYTDVDGVYSADPRIIPNATLLPSMRYEEILEYASAGAKVLHPRAVEIAANYGIKVNIISTFSNVCGTTIEGGNMINDIKIEQRRVSGITIRKNCFFNKISGDSVEDILNYVKTTCCVHGQSNRVHNQLLEDQLIAIEPSVKEVSGIIISSKELDINTSSIFGIETFDNVSLISIIGYGIRNDMVIMSRILSFAQKYNVIYVQNSESMVQIFIHDQTNNADELVLELHTEFIG